MPPRISGRTTCTSPRARTCCAGASVSVGSWSRAGGLETRRAVCPDAGRHRARSPGGGVLPHRAGSTSRTSRRRSTRTMRLSDQVTTPDLAPRRSALAARRWWRRPSQIISRILDGVQPRDRGRHSSCFGCHPATSGRPTLLHGHDGAEITNTIVTFLSHMAAIGGSSITITCDCWRRAASTSVGLMPRGSFEEIKRFRIPSRFHRSRR